MDRGAKKEKLIPRQIAFVKVIKKEEQIFPVFAIRYNPRLPCIQKTLRKYWNSMKHQVKYLSEVVKQPPLTAYKRQEQLRNLP